MPTKFGDHLTTLRPLPDHHKKVESFEINLRFFCGFLEKDRNRPKTWESINFDPSSVPTKFGNNLTTLRPLPDHHKKVESFEINLRYFWNHVKKVIIRVDRAFKTIWRCRYSYNPLL